MDSKSTATDAQRERIIEALRIRPHTSYDLRRLGIYQAPARVKELRDGHLTAMKMAASEVSERMTMWMVVPSLVFGLFVLEPPLLTLVSSG